MLDPEELGRHVGALVKSAVEAATAPLRAELDALRLKVQEIPAGHRGEKGDDGADGRDGVDGKSVDLELTKAAVAEALPGLLALAKVELVATVEKAVEDLQQTIKAPADGKDGTPGRDGRDGLQGLQGLPGDKGLDGVDGKDGKDGKEGADGLDLKDLAVELAEDGRTIVFKMADADRAREWRVTPPVVLDAGLFAEGKSYAKGDAVTWGGSIFIAQKSEPAGKPGETGDWRLSVKRGREGKAGENGRDGQKGLDGRPGLDLTQMGPDGSKWR